MKVQTIYKTMLSYCLNCRKNIQSKDPEVVKTKNERIILLSKCSVSSSKKSRFLKEQEARGLLSSLGIRAPLSQIPFVGPVLFNSIKQVNTRYKMNKIMNKFLLTGDKLMPEMHLRQHGFRYSAFVSFTKIKERIKKI